MTTGTIPHSKVSHADPDVERKLRSAWRKERRFVHTRGLCHMLLWLVALVLLDLLIDWLLRIPPGWRGLLLGTNVVALAWVLYDKWLRNLRSYDPVRVALQVERQHPELRSVLVSYVQLDEQPDGLASPGLIQAVRRQAVRMTGPINFREIVSFRELGRIFMFSAAVVLFFGAVNVKWNEVFRVLFTRLLDPTAELQYPTNTRIESVTGDRSIPQFGKIRIEAVWSGMAPSEARIHIRPADSKWEKRSMEAGGERSYSFTYSDVRESFAYRVRLGDAESGEYRVTVVPPPKVTSASATVKAPDYLGGNVSATDNLNLNVPAGAMVRWRIDLDRPLSSARLVRADDKARSAAPTIMELDGPGLAATCEIQADRDMRYRFQWVEKEHGYEYLADTIYDLKVKPDRPPTADVIQPAQDEKATAVADLPVEFDASDDYGLTSAAIVYSLDGGAEKRRQIEGISGSSFRKQVVWPLLESMPELNENVKDSRWLTFYIEVADNHAIGLGPNVGQSRPVRVEILSEAAYRKYLAERKARLMQEIAALHKEEVTAGTEVRIMKDPAAAVAPAPEGVAPPPVSTQPVIPLREPGEEPLELDVGQAPSPPTQPAAAPAPPEEAPKPPPARKAAPARKAPPARKADN